METRTRLYSKSKPEGKLFFTHEAVKIALENGWKTAPWLVESDEPEAKTRGAKAAKKDR